MPTERKLTAVMFSDIVGYTALMSKDEEHTLELLQTNRELHESLVPDHRGELIEEIGDGTLCCFQSALDAVNCAMAIQRACSDVPGLTLRIGIHLGDIVFVDGNVFGDGVNVASRIETAADPGGIHISEQIYLQVKNHPEISATFVGQKNFKNVDRPVGVYAVDHDGGAEPSPYGGAWAPEKRSRKPIWIGAAATIVVLGLVAILVVRPWMTSSDLSASVNGSAERASIVVLPFDDYSDSESRGHLADGMTDLLIADLAKVEQMLVIARTSAEHIRRSERSPAEISRQLNIDYFVEGSVLLVGDSVRITAQLINSSTEEHVWSSTYQGHLSSILSMQSQAAAAIVDEIEIKLTPDEERRLAETRRVIPEAYSLHLEGVSRFRAGAWPEAAALLQKSIEIDPAYAPAHALSASVHTMLAGFAGVGESGTLARAAVRSALDIDPDVPLGHVAAGMVHLNLDWNWDEAEKAYLRAIDLNPGYPGAHEAYAHLLFSMGRLEEAEREGLLAKASDPLSVSVNNLLASLAYHTDRYNETIAYCERSLELAPDDPHAIFNMGLAYEALGDSARSREAFERSLAFESQFTLLAYQRLGLWDVIPAPAIQGAAEANPFVVGVVHAERGEYDRAIELIRKSMDLAPAWLVYLRPQFEGYPALWSDPRMKEIAREVGLASG